MDTQGQDTRAARPGEPARQTMLTFRLHGEVFALPVARVHEIIDPLPVTRVPRTDAFAPGLINVRGSVVPVVDLRYRLGMPPQAASTDSRMVVLDGGGEDGAGKLAMMADSVEQVIEVDAATVEPVPEIGIAWPGRYLAGVARRDGDLIILLQPETAFEPAAGHPRNIA